MPRTTSKGGGETRIMANYGRTGLPCCDDLPVAGARVIGVPTLTVGVDSVRSASRSPLVVCPVTHLQVEPWPVLQEADLADAPFGDHEDRDSRVKECPPCQPPSDLSPPR